MSFNLVTALWIARIFIVYTLMVVILPCAVLHRFLKGRSLGQKFVFSVVLGNFFYIMRSCSGDFFTSQADMS